MEKNKFAYLFSDIPDVFEEVNENFLDEEFLDEEFLDEFLENHEYLHEYCGYLTNDEYLRKYYGIITH